MRSDFLQKETKVTKTSSQLTLRASLSSVQISESEQRLVSEVISSVASGKNPQPVGRRLCRAGLLYG
jgi:hypothetical protein